MNLNLNIMKKSTIRRYEAQTTNKMTAANLNKVAGKIDARTIVNMDKSEADDYLKHAIATAKKTFKSMYENRTWVNVDASKVRAILNDTTIENIETVKTCTGVIDWKKLVNKAVAKAAKEAQKEENQKVKEAAKEAKKQEKQNEKDSEKALSCILEEAA